LRTFVIFVNLCSLLIGRRSAIIKFVNEIDFDQLQSSFTTANSMFYPLAYIVLFLSLNRPGSFSLNSNGIGTFCFYRVPEVPNQYISRFDSTMTTVWEKPAAI